MFLNKLNFKVLRNKKCLDNLKYFNSAKTISTTTKRLQENKPQKLSYEYNQYGHLDIIGATIGQQLTKISLERPNDLAYKFCLTQKSFTFLELKQRVDELAQCLLNLGFKKGDNLALLLPNLPELNLTVLAAASIGVVSILMNPAYQAYEIEYMLQKTKCKGVLILENLKQLQHYDLLKRIVPELGTCPKGELKSEKLPHLKHVIMCDLMPNDNLESKHKGVWTFNEVKKHDSVASELPYVDIDDNFAMMFTSGSTGFPKAAQIKHAPIINTSRFIHQFTGAAESFKNICIPIPTFHIFGLCCGLVSSLTNGNKTIYPHIIPDTLSTMKAIQNEKCTTIKGAPTIYTDLLNHPERKNFDLSSLETMLIGASTVPKDLLLKVKESLDLKNIIIGYAMTESSCSGIVTSVNDINVSEKVAYESLGRNFVELKIRDQITGEIVPRNTDGEICLRGYGLINGYYEDEAKTKEAFDDSKWYLTGDIGCMDDQGYVYFKSRAKELVIRGGINIYPSEIEGFLRNHPDIIDCYVIGVPDERLGEELCVWIKLKPEAKELTVDHIKEFCKGNISHFKIPKYVKIVDAFPVSATAKIQKFKMVDQMKKELNL